MKRWINTLAPVGSITRYFLSIARHRPFSFLQSLFRSVLASRALTGKFLPITCVVYPGMRLGISRCATARVKIEGIIKCTPFLGAVGDSGIILEDNSVFRLAGNFEIGRDVRIFVSDGAKLVIGGQRASTGSGITAETTIMVEKSLAIGHDVIIAWGCFITDSDWHDISNVTRSSPVVIGDNVWISHGVSILKGANVPEGCIVGAQSVVITSGFPVNALIAGNPAVLRREGVSWAR